MKIVCIFCKKQKDSSKEHILPESLGGNLTTEYVCRDCNSYLGHKVDGPFVNLLFMALPRYINGLNDSVKELHKEGVTEDGIKIRLNKDNTPYIIPTFTSQEKEGEYSVSITIDKSDEKNVEKMVVGRLKAIWDKTNTKYDDNILKEEATKIISKATSKTEDVAIVISFKIDLSVMVFEFQKIAYELAYTIFGDNYLGSNTANMMCKSIFNLDKTVPLHGQVPLAEDHLASFFPRNDHHYILIIEGNCYIKVFGISGTIQFDDSGKYYLPQEQAVLYEFDPASKTHSKMLFAEYLKTIGAFGA